MKLAIALSSFGIVALAVSLVLAHGAPATAEPPVAAGHRTPATLVPTSTSTSTCAPKTVRAETLLTPTRVEPCQEQWTVSFTLRGYRVAVAVPVSVGERCGHKILPSMLRIGLCVVRDYSAVFAHRSVYRVPRACIERVIPARELAKPLPHSACNLAGRKVAAFGTSVYVPEAGQTQCSYALHKHFEVILCSTNDSFGFYAIATRS